MLTGKMLNYLNLSFFIVKNEKGFKKIRLKIGKAEGNA